MDKDEATALLKRLEEHFGEPVMPVSSYCKKLSAWADLAEKVGILSSDTVSDVRLSIFKSNLLYRLIYLGEEIRTIPCPVHKGKWSGLGFADSVCECIDRAGNLTGWLPEKKK